MRPLSPTDHPMTLIEQRSHVENLCVGDVMLDRFISGTVKPILPESPVPVLSIGKSSAVPGGAANVARNLAALGGPSTARGCWSPPDMAERTKPGLAASNSPSLMDCCLPANTSSIPSTLT